MIQCKQINLNNEVYCDNITTPNKYINKLSLF